MYFIYIAFDKNCEKESLIKINKVICYFKGLKIYIEIKIEIISLLGVLIFNQSLVLHVIFEVLDQLFLEYSLPLTYVLENVQISADHNKVAASSRHLGTFKIKIQFVFHYLLQAFLKSYKVFKKTSKTIKVT